VSRNGDDDVAHDLGFTHIALAVSDVDRSIDFYRRYADMSPVHRRTSSDGVRVAWITDRSRPFIIVLLESAVTHELGGWAHLGIGVASRTEVDRRVAAAVEEGLVTFGPHDSGPPAGYYGIVVDPDGHNLEIAFGQEVAFTVTHEDHDPTA
jgi:catechol 2,3-dioxygenase-like lactoylglutathione lyase family enzyme